MKRLLQLTATNRGTLLLIMVMIGLGNLAGLVIFSLPVSWFRSILVGVITLITLAIGIIGLITNAAKYEQAKRETQPKE